MSEKEIQSIQDDYDLVALLGKYMSHSDISFEVKDAIKLIAKECFNIGYELGLKANNKDIK